MASGHSWSNVVDLLVHILVFRPLLLLSAISRQLWSLLIGNACANDGRVEVRRILWQHQLRQGMGDPLTGCLHVHARYEDARAFAWRDPNTHLQHMSEDGATFIRTTDGVNVFHSSVRAFAFLGINDFAEEFAVVPIELFRRIADEELENLRASGQQKQNGNEKKLILMASHPRCGGTVIVQHFEDLLGSVVMNEPGVLINWFGMCLGNPARKDLLKRVLLFNCKPMFKWKGIVRIAIKIPNLVPWVLRDAMEIEDELPFDIRFMFGYRKTEPAFRSWLRIATEIASDSYSFASELPILGRWFPDIFINMDTDLVPLNKAGLMWLVGENEWKQRYKWVDAFDFTTKTKTLTTFRHGMELPVGRTSLAAHFFCFHLVGMLLMRELNRDPTKADRVLPIRYEDLMMRPEIWEKEIVPFCGLERDWNQGQKPGETAKPTTVSALRQDSQRQSRYSREKTSVHRTKIAEEDWKTLDTMMKATGMANSAREFQHPF